MSHPQNIRASFGITLDHYHDISTTQFNMYKGRFQTIMNKDFNILIWLSIINYRLSISNCYLTIIKLHLTIINSHLRLINLHLTIINLHLTLPDLIFNYKYFKVDSHVSKCRLDKAKINHCE